jgi:hypothetical protein
VPAILGAERLRDLADFQACNHFAELRNERFVRGPAEVAAVDRRSGIFGDGFGDRCEVVAGDDLVADALQSLTGSNVVEYLGRRYQNVARPNQVDQLPLAAAPIGKANDMETAAAAKPG